MAYSEAVIRSPTAVPGAVRHAANSFLAVAVILLVLLILAAVAKGLTLRGSLGMVTLLVVSLHLSLALRGGESKARKHGLVFGGLVALMSSVGLVYTARLIAESVAPREVAILLADVLVIAQAGGLIAGCTAVAMLLRRESREFFRNARSG